MKISIFACSYLGCVATFCAATADARIEKQGASDVAFTATGPAGLRIVGTTSDLSVTDGASEFRITVPLSNLTTGIGLRDSHMRDKYLQVPSYPNAELVVERSSLQLPADGAASDATVAGTLRLHGQVKPVQVHYHSARSGRAVTVGGGFHINMNDFGIQVPSYLGITVKPDVDVTAHFVVSDS
jgi:polyisoprenoid-binding protein YceI